jgi:hypothetical protein
MARIIPTDDRPGAREAGTIEFLDRYLSGLDFIYAKPDGSGFEKLEGKRAEAWKQRIEIIRAKYVTGIKELDLDFFPLLALHTRQGFYSDPIYGPTQSLTRAPCGRRQAKKPKSTFSVRFRRWSVVVRCTGKAGCRALPRAISSSVRSWATCRAQRLLIGRSPMRIWSLNPGSDGREVA